MVGSVLAAARRVYGNQPAAVWVHWSTDGYLDQVRRPVSLDDWLKPVGAVWVSDETNDDSWRNWCFREEFRHSEDHKATELVIDYTDTLRIRNVDQFDRFEAAYRFQRTHYTTVNWVSIARDWRAVFITPYLWERRAKFMWYATWDCASGVILDPTVVTDLIPRPDLKWEPPEWIEGL